MDRDMLKKFEMFYWNMITRSPDLAFIIIGEGGSTRWTLQRVQSKQPLQVVGTARGGLLPIRDFHIYRVLDRPAGSDPDRPDAVTTEVGQQIHRSMCGQAKLGRNITIGEIMQAAKAQVEARLAADQDRTADIIHPTGAAEHLTPEEHERRASTHELPRTAVQICLGDTVVSGPFNTPQQAQESPQWKTMAVLPEVLGGSVMLWLRPVFGEKEDED